MPSNLPSAASPRLYFGDEDSAGAVSAAVSVTPEVSAVPEVSAESSFFSEQEKRDAARMAARRAHMARLEFFI